MAASSGAPMAMRQRSGTRHTGNGTMCPECVRTTHATSHRRTGGENARTSDRNSSHKCSIHKGTVARAGTYRSCAPSLPRPTAHNPTYRGVFLVSTQNVH
eukprot:550880-Prymnesium_polylepis.1